MQKDSSNKITLTNGNADKGGAVYVENAGEFTAYDLNISGCKAGGSGGAIFTENSTTVTVINGKLSSCTAGGNGGAIVNGGALNISSITFESNEAKGSNSYGGAIYSDGTSSVTASGCTFGGTEDTKGNKAQNGGAAAIVGNSENAVVFTSCIFQKNTAAGSHGGAIFAERAITVKGTSSNKTKILSNKIGGASGKGGGIYSSAKLDIKYAEISGNTVTGGSGGGIYSTGILNIINSTIGGTGAYSGNTANGNGGGIYAGEKSVCTIKDSDIVGNTANGMGGGLFVSSDGTEKGKCTITGGTFKKNEAKGSGGGAIYCFGVLVIKDCTIGGTGVGDGNTASGITGGGGGIFIYKGSCTLTNTTVTGNTISGNAKGAGVFLYSSSSDNPTFTVGGTTKIGSDTDTNAVYVGYAPSYQAVVTADDLDGAYINLEPANYPNQKNRELVKGAGAAGYAQYFYLTGLPSSDEWSLKPNAGDNGLVLRKQETIDSSNGGTWKKLKDAIAAAEDGDVIKIIGEIKATNDTDNSGELEINTNLTIKGEGSAAVLDANNVNHPSTKHRIFKVTSGKTLTLQNLTLKGGKETNVNDHGGAIYNAGKLTIVSCKIIENEAKTSGGAIYINQGAQCTIKGDSTNKSVIAKNKALKGAGIQIDGECIIDEYTVIGGSGEGNTGAQYGGGVFIGSKGKCTINGGVEISYNIADKTTNPQGGGIYVEESLDNKGKLILDGSSDKQVTIKENEATRGAGIYCEGETSMKYTEVTGNKAKAYGGGIYVNNKAICNINAGVKIEENKCTNMTSSGGGIYISESSGNFGTVNITGESAEKPVLIKNNVGDVGCGIFTQGTLKMKFTEISGHTANNGGGIYVSLGSVEIDSCKIDGNESLVNGGAVYVGAGTFTMKGSTQVTVADDKNDIYLEDGKMISLVGNLNKNSVARITPAAYGTDKTVLTGDTAANCTKFAVTPNGTQEWEIDTAGKLAKKRTTITIYSNTARPWTTLRNEVEKETGGADIIIINGDITATNSDKSEITVKRPVTIKATETHTLNASQIHRIFSVESGGNLTLKNLTLKNGNSTGSGGIIYVNNATVYLNGCTLSGGSAYNGGGIALSSAGGTCTLENTTITGCTANTAAHGGAVAVLGPSEGPNPKCKFIMKNGTYINNEIGKNKNDVYLVSAAFIKLENFTNGTARITPLTYAEGHKVLEGATAENYKKFTVTPKGGQNWYVNADGKLTTTEP